MRAQTILLIFIGFAVGLSGLAFLALRPEKNYDTGVQTNSKSLIIDAQTHQLFDPASQTLSGTTTLARNISIHLIQWKGGKSQFHSRSKIPVTDNKWVVHVDPDTFRGGTFISDRLPPGEYSLITYDFEMAGQTTYADHLSHESFLVPGSDIQTPSASTLESQYSYADKTYFVRGGAQNTDEVYVVLMDLNYRGGTDWDTVVSTSKGINGKKVTIIYPYPAERRLGKWSVSFSNVGPGTYTEYVYDTKTHYFLGTQGGYEIK